MDTKKTGLLISQVRKEQGLTQKELAEQLHVSDRTVSKWERGVGFPDVTLLEPLSDTLGLPVQCLLCGTRELNAPAPQTDKTIRDAVRDIYVLCRNKTRRNISTILASLVLLALSGVVLFAILVLPPGDSLCDPRCNL